MRRLLLPGGPPTRLLCPSAGPRLQEPQQLAHPQERLPAAPRVHACGGPGRPGALRSSAVCPPGGLRPAPACPGHHLAAQKPAGPGGLLLQPGHPGDTVPGRAAAQGLPPAGGRAAASGALRMLRGQRGPDPPRHPEDYPPLLWGPAGPGVPCARLLGRGHEEAHSRVLGQEAHLPGGPQPPGRSGAGARRPRGPRRLRLLCAALSQVVHLPGRSRATAGPREQDFPDSVAALHPSAALPVP